MPIGGTGPVGGSRDAGMGDAAILLPFRSLTVSFLWGEESGIQCGRKPVGQPIPCNYSGGTFARETLKVLINMRPESPEVKTFRV